MANRAFSEFPLSMDTSAQLKTNYASVSIFSYYLLAVVRAVILHSQTAVRAGVFVCGACVRACVS